MGREFLHKNRCLLAEGRSHLSPVFKKTLKASLLEHWILPARYHMVPLQGGGRGGLV